MSKKEKDKEKDLENLVVLTSEGTNDDSTNGGENLKEADKEPGKLKDDGKGKGNGKDKDKDDDELKPPVFLSGLGGL